MPTPNPTRPRALVICLDAYGTLFRPKTSIDRNYLRIGRKYDKFYPTIKKHDKLRDVHRHTIKAAFKNSFRRMNECYPNYGRFMKMERSRKEMSTWDWWNLVIKGTFEPFFGKDGVPPKLIQAIWESYTSGRAYSLYSDVKPFFQFLAMAKNKTLPALYKHSWQWDSIMVGIISNTDERLPSILDHLGVSVRKHDLGYETQKDIDLVSLSYFCGTSKPNRRIFDETKQMALDRLGPSFHCDDVDFWHIGNEVENDAWAAARAGWYGIYLERNPSASHNVDFAFRDPEILEHPASGLDSQAFDESKRILKINNLVSLTQGGVDPRSLLIK